MAEAKTSDVYKINVWKSINNAKVSIPKITIILSVARTPARKGILRWLITMIKKRVPQHNLYN